MSVSVHGSEVAAPVFSTEADAIAPDIHTAHDQYAQRFAGKHGAYMLAVQRHAVMDLITPWKDGRVLEVGGGHAQLAPALVDAGYDVTIHGSSEACKLRPDQMVKDRRYTFVHGSAHALPLQDQSFDVVVSVRMMAHIRDPELFVAELCRVAKHAVVIDFSPAGGLYGKDTSLAYYLKHWAEGATTRRFNRQHLRDVQAMFSSQGLTSDRRVGQFCLPMALHRMVGWTHVPRAIEWLFAKAGLGPYLGSPMILRAVRPDSSVVPAPPDSETDQG